MKLFRGLERTDYQDVLRCIGLLLDERQYRNFRLVEHEDGIVVQVQPTVDGQTESHYQTFLLTDDDIKALLHKAYRRRIATTGPLRINADELPVGQDVWRVRTPARPSS